MSRRNWIPVRGAGGRHSRQAHADMPDGTFEREMSKEGFFGPAAFFHHRLPPTGWSDFQGPLRPRAFDLTRLGLQPGSPWAAAAILRNAACEIRFWRPGGVQSAIARNGDGDTVLFIHRGNADLYTDWGRLAVEAGDYVYLPRGALWLVEPIGASSFEALMIEATNAHFTWPERGLLGPHAFIDPAILTLPQMDDAFRTRQEAPGPWRIEIKKRAAVSTATYAYFPMDAVGWHGELAPVKFNVRDLRPVMSHRYHLPPSAHTTFVSDRFVVCTFCPRPFETDPGALKVPFFHNNDDYDEVLFYHAGDFFSRDNIHAGMLTFHPSGFTHGPHPKALTRMLSQPKPATDEYAVMIDTRDPLDVAPGAEALEWAGYVDSWKPVPTTAGE
jgi:homogentisate 1,2-dioxygenase